MIPPLLLDVKPNHNVLDMCAAPGSKTAQIIEMMHSRDGSVPSGLLVANDKDNKRCYMLVHQTKRLNSPSLVVLNEDASCIPNLCFDDQRKVPIQFDRILCDVPCSGDGTFRKNLEVWRTWSATNANGLHRLQARILRRGLEMLAVGGRLVYSTCSLNPVEDEAVVASLLDQCQGSVELVDCSDSLPDLKRSPGLSTWKVAVKNGELVSSHDDVPEELKESHPASMFPRNKPDLHLERCWRVLPHFQNTGGFFIVALRKLAVLPWMRSAPKTTETKTEGQATPPATVDGEKETSNGASSSESPAFAPRPPARPKRKFKNAFKEDPFVFFKGEEDPSWITVRDFFKLGEGIEPHQLLTRSHGGRKRAIYMTSSTISKLIPKNEDFVKVINTGVRVFARSTQAGAACDFRVVQEGLHAILPHINARRYTILASDALMLLANWSPQLYDLSKELQKLVEDVPNGSCVLTLPAGSKSSTPEDSEDVKGFSARALSCPLHFSAWKSKFTVRLLVTADDRSHFLMLLGQGKVEEIQAQVEAQMKELAGRPKKNTDGEDAPMEEAGADVSCAAQPEKEGSTGIAQEAAADDTDESPVTAEAAADDADESPVTA
eukprot:scpid54740/ scgid11435/ tRNA (cytosine(34)-C(5))-methyltransferase; NOL1/NOP2/Sun domain family member 2